MHEHNVFDSDTYFVIDPITRKVSNASSQKTALMQGDHNSERFTFEIPRHVEGHDMSKCDKVRIHYLNTDVKTKAEYKDVYTKNRFEYAKAAKDIARKWGIPYLDLAEDENVPLLHRTNKDTTVCETAINARLNAFKISDEDTHANAKAHEYESTIVEAFLRRL